MEGTKLEIIIVEDHPIFKLGLENIIKDRGGLDIKKSFSDGEHVSEYIIENTPDILFLDIDLPVKSGIEIAKELKDKKLKTKIIFITSNKSYNVFLNALEIGAQGYLLKDNAIDNLFESIEKVMQGLIYISPQLSEQFINDKTKKEKTSASLNKVLTRAEKNILKLVSLHLLSKEIADKLFISIKTVENHRTNICKKLSLSGTNSLLAFAIENKDDIKML